MSILLYSIKTKKQYILLPTRANYTLIKKGTSSLPHYHNVYHIMFVTGGEGNLENDDGRYMVRERDIFVINPGEKHILSSDNDRGLTYFTFNFYLLENSTQTCTGIDYVWNNIICIENLNQIEDMESLTEITRLDMLFDFHINDIYVNFDESNWEQIISIIGNFSETLDRFKTYSLIGSEDNLSYKIMWFDYFSKFFWDYLSIVSINNINSTWNTKEKALINGVINYLRDNIHEKYVLSELASDLNYNPVYLCTFFKKKTGYTISDYFNKMKINKSCEYLKMTDKSITEIASMLNFSSSQHFNRNFKKEKKISPKDYRKRVIID